MPTCGQLSHALSERQLDSEEDKAQLSVHLITALNIIKRILLLLSSPME